MTLSNLDYHPKFPSPNTITLVVIKKHSIHSIHQVLMLSLGGKNSGEVRMKNKGSEEDGWEISERCVLLLWPCFLLDCKEIQPVSQQEFLCKTAPTVGYMEICALEQSFGEKREFIF